MADSVGKRIPLATYRLQLRGEFPFAAATRLVPYANALGISDYYCSPIFLSTPGSSHGYDVNDYRRIDPELGGRPGLERLHAALRERGMSLLLDFVPNHMGINGPGLLNTWWRDLLQNGAHSPYARFFDIDWNSGSERDQARVLVPILDDHYGRVLEAGRLKLVFDAGGLSVAYGDMRFPVAPHTYQRVLEAIRASSDRGAELTQLAQGFATLPKPSTAEGSDTARIQAARFSELKQHVAALLESHLPTRRLLDDQLRDWNGQPGDAASFDSLNDILEEQHYRLAFWKAGVHETNYRRFFAIDTLIGLRVEIPEVFHETHALLARLLREKIVTGLRIDHVDGLRDPQQYLDRLQALVSEEGAAKQASLYVVVEKILAENETLPTEWATDGTTGYEFIGQLAGVLVAAQSERQFTATYAAFCGETLDFDDLVYENKRMVLDEMFANAVTRLASQLTDMLQADRRWRDVTRYELTVAVREVMAGHGVYRSYRRGVEKMSERDRRVAEQACAVALRRNQRLGAEPFELLRDVLTGVYPPEGAVAGLRERLSDWVLSFQQYTGAVMAKAVEDTAFYTYNRFIALNEVAGNPGRFGGTVGGFHTTNVERARRTPHALLATATHDTKLGEDVRARLYALSEIPHEWHDCLVEWRELNQRHKTTIDGRSAPDANEEYRLYQVLLGAWPANDAEPDELFRERLREHVRKSVNEARRNTTWVQPNEPWLQAGDHFINRILSEDTGREFLASFRPRARRLAHLGMVNSLAQVVLKTTSPGVPDFYQGAELWDLSLVDPDNRRPVDFAIREAMLNKPPSSLDWTELLGEWRNGEIKLQVTRALLQFRREHVEIFQSGDYQPLETGGRFAEHAVAFARHDRVRTVVVVVPRSTSRLGCPPLGLVWDDTTVILPASEGLWKNVLTGRTYAAETDASIAGLFADLPFAVLTAVRELGSARGKG
jgi:(1->4)-alpha-D-glucan 1-alpha-D-glucosylmutase